MMNKVMKESEIFKEKFDEHDKSLNIIEDILDRTHDLIGFLLEHDKKEIIYYPEMCSEDLAARGEYFNTTPGLPIPLWNLLPIRYFYTLKYIYNNGLVEVKTHIPFKIEPKESSKNESKHRPKVINKIKSIKQLKDDSYIIETTTSYYQFDKQTQQIVDITHLYKEKVNDNKGSKRRTRKV